MIGSLMDKHSVQFVTALEVGVHVEYLYRSWVWFGHMEWHEIDIPTLR